MRSTGNAWRRFFATPLPYRWSFTLPSFPFHAPWQADWAFGYGYPFYTFYAPLGYYAGALSHFLLGLDYGPATKLSFYASLYLSGLVMYALVYVIGQREQWPRLAWWALGAATVFILGARAAVVNVDCCFSP